MNGSTYFRVHLYTPVLIYGHVYVPNYTCWCLLYSKPTIFNIMTVKSGIADLRQVYTFFGIY